MPADITLIEDETEQRSPNRDLAAFLSETYPDLDEDNLFHEQHEEIERRVREIESGSCANKNEAMEQLFALRLAAQMGECLCSEELLARQKNQFEQLLEDAQSGSDNGNNGRLILNQIMRSHLAPVLNPLNDWAVERTFATVENMCHTPEYKNLFARSVMINLAHGYKLAETLKHRSIQAFTMLVKRDYFPAPSLEELAESLISGLELELEMTVQNASSCQILGELIEVSTQLPCPALFPFLQGVSSKHKDESTRQKADQALYDLEHSSLKAWNDSVADCVSSDETRAKIIESTAASDLHLSDKLIDITAVVKGNPIDNWSSPLVKPLSNLLQNDNESLRLLAARAIVQKHGANIVIQDHTANPLLEKVIYTLSKHSMNTHAPAAKEAAMLLDTLETCTEEIRMHVRKAKEQASLEFVQQQNTGI